MVADYNGWQTERATWPNHESSSFVQSEDICWHVQRMGNGPALLLVHGTGAATHSWRDLMPLLAQRHTVLAMDLPGHGFTHAAAGAASIDGMSAAVAGLLRRLSFRPEMCVGHSAGAVVSCKLALTGAIKPQAIVSINGAFLPLRGFAGRLFSPAARLLAGNATLASLLAPRGRRASELAADLLARSGSVVSEEGVDLYARLVRKPQHVAGALRMMGSWNLSAFQRELPHMQVPLLLLVGSRDSMVPPEQAERVQACVKHARIQRLEGLGHLAHEEQPALVAARIAAVCPPR